MAEWEDLVEVNSEFIVCKECGGMVRYQSSGRHVCEDCGKVYLDDFGKVKAFLEKRGPSNIVEIAAGTGLSRTGVNKLLREGRIQVAENSQVLLLCESCGKPIKYGRYCQKCFDKLEGNSKKAIYNALSDEDVSPEKMRFLKKDKL